ncbi:MAG: hypothetical protein IT317_23000 [Anaerolineales bacterium]|nr:hypothetical protein [Anaerolineales bacterium]
MTRRIVIGVLIFLVLAAGAVGVGAMAFRAGMMQGLAASGQVVAPDGAGPMMWWHSGPMMFGGRGHMGWGWGGGFGFLQCLFPLFGLLLLFALLRFTFGPRHWGWGRRGNGPWGGGPGMNWGEHAVPPGFEEWHRRAHGQAAPPPPPAEPPAQPGQ